MTNKESGVQKAPLKNDEDEVKDRPDADEPVAHEEHGEDAEKEASERMLLREPQD